MNLYLFSSWIRSRNIFGHRSIQNVLFSCFMMQKHFHIVRFLYISHITSCCHVAVCMLASSCQSSWLTSIYCNSRMHIETLVHSCVRTPAADAEASWVRDHMCVTFHSTPNLHCSWHFYSLFLYLFFCAWNCIACSAHLKLHMLPERPILWVCA